MLEFLNACKVFGFEISLTLDLEKLLLLLEDVEEESHPPDFCAIAPVSEKPISGRSPKQSIFGESWWEKEDG